MVSLNVESTKKKKVKLIEIDNKKVIIRGLGVLEIGRDWLKGTKFQLSDE